MNNKYELLSEKYIDEIKSKVSLLRHKKSGARVLLMSNNDTNKTFTIGFRTPPTDDTGVPHILEHSTLCGSKKFPVKDPFIELAKSSLNTFLNAMTFPDKTIYPIASQNLKDYKNLMEVYMDAVFYPNVYIHEEILKQEGWHYELEDVDGEITYNGVVYNEMKGAFSSAEQVVMRQSRHVLYPDTTYGVESGGDPKYIPDLTYDAFLDFHKKFYSPSNSYIVLYGDMDMEERLDWMDKEYLSKFDVVEFDSHIDYQKEFKEPTYTNMYYPVGKNDSTENKTYYSFNTIIGDAKDTELLNAFTILEYILLETSGAPLKQALVDSKLAGDVFAMFVTDLLQPGLSVIAKDCPSGKIKEFETVIKDTLTKLVNEGLDKNSLRAAINYFDFKNRECDFGGAPKGLIYTISALGSWLYDDEDPYSRLENNKIYEKLMSLVDTDYFEKLIEKYLLNNNATAYLAVDASNTLLEEEAAALKEKLHIYKESLTKEQLEKLVEDTKALKAYQAAPSTKEELATMPLLKKEDLKVNLAPIYNKEKEVAGVKVINHEIDTNGIGYLKLMFNTLNVPERLIPYIGLLDTLLVDVDTENYSYLKLNQEIQMYTGGLTCGTSIYSVGDNEVAPYFFIKGSALYKNLNKVVDLMKEVLYTSNFKDQKRIYEMLAEMKSNMQMKLVGEGHVTAYSRALSYFRTAENYKEKVEGIDEYQFIENLFKNFDSVKDEVTANLEELVTYIFRKENMLVSYTGTDFSYEEYLDGVISSLYNKKIVKEEFKFVPELKNEGFKTPAQVQFVARAGEFDPEKYSGSMQVLRIALSYDYLYPQVRILGGAYGCMTAGLRNGTMYFVSYRDPNLERTNQVFEDVPKFIDELNCDESDFIKYIISAVGRFTAPMSPSVLGDYALDCYIKGTTEEDTKKIFNEILEADLQSVKALKPIYEEVLNNGAICVVGNESKIDACEGLLKEKKNLFN